MTDVNERVPNSVTCLKGFDFLGELFLKRSQILGQSSVVCFFDVFADRCFIAFEESRLWISELGCFLRCVRIALDLFLQGGRYVLKNNFVYI